MGQHLNMRRGEWAAEFRRGLANSRVILESFKHDGRHDGEIEIWLRPLSGSLNPFTVNTYRVDVPKTLSPREAATYALVELRMKHGLNP